MKTILASALALALSMFIPSQGKAQNANQILGGYTAITLSSSFVAYTRESGIFLGDLNGNPLPGAKTAGEVVDNLGTVSGVIDLGTAKMNISFQGGFLINYVGRASVRVENLVLQTGKRSVITGDLTENGAFLGRQEIFVVIQDSDLALPLKPVAGVLTLPSLSLALSPQLATQLASIIGTQFTPATQIATASSVAVVSQTPKITATN